MDSCSSFMMSSRTTNTKNLWAPIHLQWGVTVRVVSGQWKGYWPKVYTLNPWLVTLVFYKVTSVVTDSIKLIRVWWVLVHLVEFLLFCCYYLIKNTIVEKTSIHSGEFPILVFVTNKNRNFAYKAHYYYKPFVIRLLIEQ